jgi:enoyl-CoA hydratase
MSELVALERERGVAIVRLQREDKHNAFNRDLAQATMETLEALDSDDDVVCVVLTGAGRAFCAGADMTEAVAAIDDNGRSDGMGAAVVRAAAFRKPLIGCINGFAYGGGAMLASACDFRIAAESASFRFPGAAYGLVVGGALLPRLIGPAMASELLFSTRVVHADEALRIGFVNRVVPDADLRERHADARARDRSQLAGSAHGDEGGRPPRSAIGPGARARSRLEPHPACERATPRALPRRGSPRRRPRLRSR